MKNGIIYKAENLINGKVYIGQTTTRFNNRISGHKHHAYILNKIVSKQKIRTKKNPGISLGF